MELGLEQKQSLILSPMQIQSMELLRMSALELEDFVENMSQENPALELLEREPEPYASLWTVYGSSRRSESAWSPEVSTPGPEHETLREHLQSQLEALTLCGKTRRAAMLIIGSLSPSGYLDDDCRELASAAGVSEDTVLQALAVVQGLEPAGVAARSLTECLCLQLERDSETDTAYKIALNHLEDMGRSHYALIARELGVPVKEVREACGRISRLQPRPGAAFEGGGAAEYILPDILIGEEDDGARVQLRREAMPSVCVSSYYRRLYHESGDSAVREYLTEKLEQARWVVRGIEQRTQTLLACAENIVRLQQDFFNSPKGGLRPMTLQDVASAMGVHGSTVSRAIRGKYLQCKRGLYPLSYFFTRAVGDEGVSAHSAKEHIKRLIAGEDRLRPLSDQRLTELLAADGVEISRRTAAKYRAELGIPPAGARKE